MNKIWEAFENLQEIVYVVDAKEYDLVYMNQLARSTFNCPRTEDYRGRKCYELLQGLPESILPHVFGIDQWIYGINGKSPCHRAPKRAGRNIGGNLSGIIKFLVNFRHMR